MFLGARVLNKYDRIGWDHNLYLQTQQKMQSLNGE